MTRPKTILIIDDDSEHARLLQLKFHRYPAVMTRVANNGEEALSLIQTNPPDLMIVDLLMPQMNGFRFLKKIKKDPKLAHIPVIIISSIYDADDKKMLYQLGMSAFYSKTDIFNGKHSPGEDHFSKTVLKLLGKKIKPQFKTVPKKISIVGEGDVVSGISQWLKEEGYQTKTVSLTMEGLDTIKQFLPDGVILCVAEKEGIKTWVEEYNRRNFIAPIVVIAQDESKRVEALRADVEGFLLTPINYAYFGQYIRMICDESKLRHSERILRQSMIKKVRDLEEAYGELQALDKHKSDFITIASHELRTPLSIIKGATDILKEALPHPKELERFFTMIDKHIEKITNIISIYLDISLINHRRIKLYIEPLFLPQLIQEASHAFSLPAEKKNLKIDIDIPDTLPPVRGDKNRCKDIFQHILDNAIKYSYEGGEIKIFAQVKGTEIDIMFEDSGPGILKEHLKKIFEKFTSLTDPIDRTTQGSGLGLYIAHRLATLQGGYITVESEYGKGSCFHVVLPIELPT